MGLFRPLSQTASTLARCAKPAVARLSTSAIRQGGAWSYRTSPAPPPSWCAKGAPAIMTFTWWWIFHGVLTEPAHIFGFWDNYPDPREWTDQQLGIPADDE
eukprot:GFUD01020642.1.p3 GENE.GFUD01020642.1~~GFUD01020642.1.p3  ORF type:complete len:101 (+),score=24.52 GFUD01020642.1:48-350(+)